jgi:hypothetical protein
MDTQLSEQSIDQAAAKARLLQDGNSIIAANNCAISEWEQFLISQRQHVAYSVSLLRNFNDRAEEAIQSVGKEDMTKKQIVAMTKWYTLTIEHRVSSADP